MDMTRTRGRGGLKARSMLTAYAQNLFVIFVFADLFLCEDTDKLIFLRFLSHWRN